jgi:hypothetical protein
MQRNMFGLKIIENMDDMVEAMEDYEIDEFYVTLEKDRESSGWKAFFFLTVDGESLAETDSWFTSKAELIEDIVSVFGEDVDILN